MSAPTIRETIRVAVAKTVPALIALGLQFVLRHLSRDRGNTPREEAAREVLAEIFDRVCSAGITDPNRMKEFLQIFKIEPDDPFYEKLWPVLSDIELERQARRAAKSDVFT